MMEEHLPGVVKALGALGGTIVALVFQPPKSVNEFYGRSAVSIVSGLLFGDALRENWLKWPDTFGSNLAAFGVVSLTSWWVLAMAVRISKKYTPKE